MKKNGKQVLFLGGIFIIAFAIWTALIQMVDVQPLGQNATNIGFATFNCWFHRLTNVNMTIYTITDWMGLIPLVVCLIFAGIGLVQLIKRRSLFKVDPDIIILGVYYVIVILAYFIFEIIPINYRPILINGIMEASYPSSTTLLVLCVMPTLVEQIQRRMSCSTLKRIITILAIAFSAFMVIGRLISGVHWFTDIVGGVLLSAGLFTVYKAVVMRTLKKQAETYPNALQKSLVNFFMFEAGFSLMFVKANSGTDDKYYIAGHVFRIVSCLNQVLFACNNAYCINEKKAIKLLETFEHKPEKYTEKVNHIFEVLGISLFECYDMTEKLYNEVNEIVSEINNFLNEESSDERKQI